MPLSDADWLALCVFKEAGGEIPDGRAAVARVVLNRTHAHYSSSGTIASTVAWPSQFSWCEFGYVAGRYVRVCSGFAAISARAQQLLDAARALAAFEACAEIAAEVAAGRYAGGDGYSALTDDTVLYANLALVARPAWAIPSRHVARIGRQDFYRDPAAHAPSRRSSPPPSAAPGQDATRAATLSAPEQP